MRNVVRILTLALLVAGDDRAAAGEGRGAFAPVRAILVEKCLVCHGNDADDLQGNYDLRTRAAALRGGESGQPAIMPGKPDESPLLRAVAWQDDALQMPPKENDRLSAEQIDTLRRWIVAGAQWEAPAATAAGPARSADGWASEPGGVRIATSGGLSNDWDARLYDSDAVWAYRPIRRPEVPTHATHPIDAFLLEKLRARGIDGFAPPANSTTLARRAAFDLTGLPPAGGVSEEEAFSETIQRLLESPHYGERQAQHWLDVVRYADTAGFSNDFERPHAWRYRDYVIRSFQADKPFDQFIREQLAGDELDSQDPELLIATGYLRMGPWEHTGMTVAAVTRQQYLDDVTHQVGVSLLGQGLRCASCHDHKFDPLPTKDYYRMQAIFAPVQFAQRSAEFLPSENVRHFAEARAQVQARLDRVLAAQEALKQKNKEAIAAFLAERGVKSLDEIPAGERPKADYLGGTFGLTKTDLSLRKIQQKSRMYLERELQRFEPAALAVYSGPPNGYTSLKPLYAVPAKPKGTVQVVNILTGGALESPSEAVSPGVLSAMAGSNEALAPSAWNTIPSDSSGRRLALAQWIASSHNTLTARVIVNRVWQQHFGRGLVATPNNFGKMGARPTHPELLDWLATWLIDRGWSLQRLHTLIMTSAAYQQSSQRPDMDKLQAIDARNDLLAWFPPRRLSAEEIRDAMLLASGELNRAAGGPGVYPEMNWEVALQPRHIMGSVAPAYLPSRTPAERNRRTIYAFRIRTLPDPLLEVFNRPGSEASCERRDETTVTPQVFALFNSEQAANRALAMAARLQREHASEEPRLAAAFQLVYGREISPAEQARCLAHLTKMTAHHRAHPPTPTELPTSVRRGMVEELTGEMVYWDEDLSPLKDYQRDLLPWQVQPEVRALADVCLVLLNSNEFLYVR
ncbi:MAG: DUF1553 domain-containing protein [Pirellulaceae bacterium]